MSTSEALRILVVVAHPHDFTHMAGTCGKHVKRGDSVTVLSVTGGVRVHNVPLEDELRKPPEERDQKIVGESSEHYAGRKRHELIDACAVFGITDVRVLGFTDDYGYLRPSDELNQAIADVILETRPHILLTHAPYVISMHGHGYAGADDHRAAGIAVQRACEIAGAPPADAKHVSHRIAKTYYTGAEFSFNDWDLIVDITDQVKNRVRAEALFTTQGHYEGFAMKRVEMGTGHSGWYGGFPYGESFLQARPRLDDHLPVSEVELRHSEQSTMDDMAALGTRIADLE